MKHRPKTMLNSTESVVYFIHKWNYEISLKEGDIILNYTHNQYQESVWILLIWHISYCHIDVWLNFVVLTDALLCMYLTEATCVKVWKRIQC